MRSITEKKQKKSKKVNKAEIEYNVSQEIEKQVIRSEPKKIKKFLKRCKYLARFPFKRVWTNIRDWKTFLIFAIVFVVVSSEVWCPYLIGFICWNDEVLRNTMFGIGSAGLMFWNVIPCTPFLLICISLTIFIKTLFSKIAKKKGLNE